MNKEIDQAQKRLRASEAECAGNHVFVDLALVQEHAEAVRGSDDAEYHAALAVCYRVAGELLAERSAALLELGKAYGDATPDGTRVAAPRGMPPALSAELLLINREIERRELIENPAQSKSILDRVAGFVR